MSALGIRLIGSSLPLRSFPALRQAAPSTSTQSRSFCSFASTSLRPKHPKSSPQSRHKFLRSLSSESPAPTRHALGRITPKRIAVRAPRSQFRSSSSAEFDPDLPEKTIWRPIIFCILLGGGTFMGAAFLTNADAVFWRERIKSAAGVIGRLKTPSDRDLARARTMNDLQHAQAQVSSWQKSLNGYVPAFILTPVLRLKVAYENWRLNTPPGQVASMKVISVMGTVFLMWRLPRIRRTMDKWFLHRPVVFGLAKLHPWKQCVTLFTSTISHNSLTHFGFNALALFSFGSAAYAYISVPVAGGPRLSTVDNTPHFYAFLLCAGLFASLSSHLYTNLVKVPRLLKTLRNPARLSSAQALAAHHSILPSLGSSGAIYSALALTACALPDTEVSLIFLPFFAIPIGYGFGGLVLFDLIGLVKGWRALDHVAHLGGALFGVLYWMFGRQAWQNARLASAPAVEQAAVETYKNWDQKRK